MINVKILIVISSLFEVSNALVNLIDNVNREHPFVFIGGYPRSGTSLMRAILEAHPEIRCGDETHIVPQFLDWNEKMETRLGPDYKKLAENFTANFLMDIITSNGMKAKRYCNKDPFQLLHMNFLSRIFPNAKFILMIRDGRAAIHSFWKRGLWNAINSTLCPIFKNVLIYDQINKTMPPSSRKYQFFELFRDSKAHNFSRAQLFCLKYWNSHMKNQYEQCLAAGPKKCMMVFYDRLVQNPGAEVPRIARFLNLSMHLNMLNHHWHFSDEIYARPHFSLSQIRKPVYNSEIKTWTEFYSPRVNDAAVAWAPMLTVLGFNI